MSGNRAMRRFREMGEKLTVPEQILRLTREEIICLRLVGNNPGYKLNSGEVDDSHGYSMWKPLEDLGLIAVVGCYKWRITSRGRVAARLPLQLAVAF